jgi:hypothetical protein
VCHSQPLDSHSEKPPPWLGFSSPANGPPCFEQKSCFLLERADCTLYFLPEDHSFRKAKPVFAQSSSSPVILFLDLNVITTTEWSQQTEMEFARSSRRSLWVEKTVGALTLCMQRTKLSLSSAALDLGWICGELGDASEIRAGSSPLSPGSPNRWEMREVRENKTPSPPGRREDGFHTLPWVSCISRLQITWVTKFFPLRWPEKKKKKSNTMPALPRFRSSFNITSTFL